MLGHGHSRVMEAVRKQLEQMGTPIFGTPHALEVEMAKNWLPDSWGGIHPFHQLRYSRRRFCPPAGPGLSGKERWLSLRVITMEDMIRYWSASTPENGRETSRQRCVPIPSESQKRSKNRRWCFPLTTGRRRSRSWIASRKSWGRSSWSRSKAGLSRQTPISTQLEGVYSPPWDSTDF